MAGPAAQLDEAKRFAEIVAILQKHHLVQGLTPEKVRDIFVDLGPTFVKFGQILSMRSDILPKEYCAALETLRTDVTPMPLTEVQDILTQAYARPWQEVFSDIGIRPLGSASIAQVHAATLTDGQRVVVKVQRPDLYDIMSRDVRLLKRAAALLKYTPLASALDFHAVLDEMWHTVQEELDFTIEANNIAEFKRLNDGVANAGQLTVNVKKSWSDAARAAQSKLLNRLIFALLDCSLLFCAAITCLAPLPRVLGLPWLALVFFAAAVAVTIALFDRRRWSV